MISASNWDDEIRVDHKQTAALDLGVVIDRFEKCTIYQTL